MNSQDPGVLFNEASTNGSSEDEELACYNHFLVVSNRKFGISEPIQSCGS